MTRNDFDKKYKTTLSHWIASHSDKVQLLDESTNDETRISIQSSSDGACPVFIASRNGSTQIHVGETIRFDEVDNLSADDGTKLTSCLTDREFALFLDAILAGAVRERIMYKKGKIIGSEGAISLGEREYKTRTTTLLGLLSKADKEVNLHYAPIKGSENS